MKMSVGVVHTPPNPVGRSAHQPGTLSRFAAVLLEPLAKRLLYRKIYGRLGIIDQVDGTTIQAIQKAIDRSRKKEFSVPWSRITNNAIQILKEHFQLDINADKQAIVISAKKED